MTLMVQHSLRRRREQRVHPVILVVTVMVAIFVQAYLPLRFPSLAILDLPLLAVIYIAVARRSPIAGTFVGLIVGLIQDAVTNLPIGINGIVGCIVGYLAASIGVRIDVENPGTRLIMNFVFILLAGVLHLLILSQLVGLDVSWLWTHELVRAIVNAVVGAILFTLLDRFRSRE